MPTIQAKSSDSFVESIGFNSAGFTDGGSIQTVFAAIILDLGCRYYRTGIGAAPMTALTKGAAMRNGARFSTGTGNNVSDLAGYASAVNSTLAANPGSIIMMEGVNEPDNGFGGGGQTGVNLAIADQITWINAAAGSAAGNVPVGTPPLATPGGSGFGATCFLTAAQGGTANQSLLGHYNIITGHWYYSGNQPEDPSMFPNLYNRCVTPLQQGAGAPFPVWITEMGSESTIDGLNLSNWSGPGATFAGEAIYLPRFFMYAFANGIARSFKYQLGQLYDGPSHIDNLFGIVEEQLMNPQGNPAGYTAPAVPTSSSQAKPCYFTIKNLIQLTTDPAPAAGIDTFVPGSMTYTLSGATFAGPTGNGAAPTGFSNVYHTVLGKRNGNFIMCFWQYQTNTPPTTPGTFAPITVTINAPAFTQYQTATLSSTPTMNAFGSAQNLVGNNATVSVGDAITLVQFISNPITTVPSQVTVTSLQTTATTQNLSWTQATQNPSDYTVTVTEIT